jgi:NADH:ubiquinone reductase (non-electrogenic)
MSNSKPTIVVLGTGFAGFSFVRSIDYRLFDVVVISPRDYFLFTPLLTSTTTGTVEFRSIIEPIRRIPNVRYICGEAVELDVANKMVKYSTSYSGDLSVQPYDQLLIAVGARAHDFGVPGVRDHAFYLKELPHARLIRSAIIERFEMASLPEVIEAERRRLLTFVIVGGGPTGVEFSAELYDFLSQEVQRRYPELVGYASITIVEATKRILGSFDSSLQEYAQALLGLHQVTLRTESIVKEVRADSVVLYSGEVIPAGLVVWSAGTAPTGLIRNSSLKLSSRGLLVVDDFLRIGGVSDVFALGDCAAFNEHPLPATAQVAQQQGAYLAKQLKAKQLGKKTRAFSPRTLGMLTYLGDNQALADLPFAKWRGFLAWLFWRSAYITKLVSLKNKVLVLVDWLRTRLFGRDISRF